MGVLLWYVSLWGLVCLQHTRMLVSESEGSHALERAPALILLLWCETPSRGDVKGKPHSVRPLKKLRAGPEVSDITKHTQLCP